MAETTVANTVETARSLINDYAQSHGWAAEDYDVRVEQGDYGDIRIRFGARALEHGPNREATNRDVWDFLRTKMLPEEFGRISLFGGSGLMQFQTLYPVSEQQEKG